MHLGACGNSEKIRPVVQSEEIAVVWIISVSDVKSGFIEDNVLMLTGTEVVNMARNATRLTAFKTAENISS